VMPLVTGVGALAVSAVGVALLCRCGRCQKCRRPAVHATPGLPATEVELTNLNAFAATAAAPTLPAQGPERTGFPKMQARALGPSLRR
jgi:hypothetical protein